MLPESIIELVRIKYGKETLYSRDCFGIAQEINAAYRAPQISETTVKRLLGFVGATSPDRHRKQRTSTLDVVAKWLGFETYDDILKEIGESDTSSEFISFEEIIVADLAEGTKIQVRYSPSRRILMTYIGDNRFAIIESENSKLKKGDIIRVTNLVLGMEFIAGDVIRDGKSLGSYRAAKDGGLTHLEIIQTNPSLDH